MADEVILGLDQKLKGFVRQTGVGSVWVSLRFLGDDIKGVCPHKHSFPETEPFERKNSACLPHPLSPLSPCDLAYSQRERSWPV